MRMKISEFREGFSPGSRPTRKTVMSWINRGEIRAEKIGGHWYVLPDPPQRAYHPATLKVVNGG